MANNFMFSEGWDDINIYYTVNISDIIFNEKYLGGITSNMNRLVEQVSDFFSNLEHDIPDILGRNSLTYRIKYGGDHLRIENNWELVFEFQLYDFDDVSMNDMLDENQLKEVIDVLKEEQKIFIFDPYKE
ncbi:MAG: hypothetical protein WC783_00980 [Candidatus Paceibacterota bacterium]|jgi:hypothetical protein